jgi:hypothetical protein
MVVLLRHKGARASGPLMIMLFWTARVPRAHDHEARGKVASDATQRAVRKSMSGPEAHAPVTIK